MAGAAAVLLLTLSPAALAQTPDFTWSGRLEAGRTLEIVGLLGDIEAEPASGDVVEVVARKRSDRSDPESVEIRVETTADGVRVCAVYPGRRGGSGCRGGGGDGDVDHGRNDVRVDFRVRVPSGVRLSATTVSGDVRARGLDAHVRARTVSGDVAVATAASADVRTVSGDIRAELGRLGTDGLTFSTVSGSIALTLPADAGARVSMRTLSGDFESEFPMTVQGRLSRRSFEGSFGDGSASLRLSTLSGDIRLRRRG